MRLTRVLVVMCVLLAVGLASAQEAKDIVIAGTIVARVRDRGAFESLAVRAAKVDHRISDVISNEDTQNPKVWMQVDEGVPTLYVGDTKVIGVYSGDAEPQGITARQLAGIWMKNIKTALPKDSQWLLSDRFDKQIGALIKLRNPAAHWEITTADLVSQRREQLLGIGCEGFLVRLVRAKVHGQSGKRR